MSPTPTQRRRWPRVLLTVGAALVGLVLVIVIAFQVSPWPSVLLIRAAGDDGLTGAEASEQYVPAGIERHLDLVYDDTTPDGRLDVIRPADLTEPQPVVVWVHGGGFIGGIKESLVPYLGVIASHGFVAVNVEYTHSPEATYPTPVRQLTQALAWVVDHADEYGIDPDRIILGGDSAGAHIAAQTALAIVDPQYAATAGLPTPSIGADQLVATTLFSGPYDMAVPTDDPTFGWFLRTVLWSYSGTKDFADDPHIAYASLVDQDLSAFPPSFISTGPYDPLLSHSERLVAELTAVGVETTSLFFDASATDDGIGHEYALHLDTPEARQAMKQTIAFLRVATHPTDREGASDSW